MKKTMFILIIVILSEPVNAQVNNPYQAGITAEENLRAVSNLSATSIGGVGFDTRYKGVKGSPMLFDTLMLSYLKIDSQDKYLEVHSNIDLVSNSLLLLNPKTRQLIYVSGNKIAELIIINGDNDMIFRTMSGTNFNKSSAEHIFYQLLNNDPYQLIKVPIKEFIEADYKQAYSPGRQYDEFNTIYKYYVISADGTLHQCQLSEKSLSKIFPEKKEIIKKVAGSGSYPDKETMIIEILKNF